MSKNETSATREKIIQTAIHLFNSEGIHTTGIDRIIAESNIAKRTFYNHFPSKNKLVEEYFYRKDLAWFAMIEKSSNDLNLEPIDRLLGIFDGLKAWFSKPDFYGCPFIKGLVDFGKEDSDPALVSCVEKHFTKTQQIVESLVKQVKPKEMKILVPQIMSLISGATVVAYASKSSQIATLNKEVAKKLLS